MTYNTATADMDTAHNNDSCKKYPAVKMKCLQRSQAVYFVKPYSYTKHLYNNIQPRIAAKKLPSFCLPVYKQYFCQYINIVIGGVMPSLPGNQIAGCFIYTGEPGTVYERVKYTVYFPKTDCSKYAGKQNAEAHYNIYCVAHKDRVNCLKQMEAGR